MEVGPRKKKTLLFPLRTDFIRVYFPPYTLQHANQKQTAFLPNHSSSQRDKNPAEPEMKSERRIEGKRIGGGSNLGQD